MSPNRRNVLVGITVLGGLFGLTMMLLRFGGSSVRLFSRSEEVDVQFTSDRADGLAEGGQVLYRGVSVGRITGVRRDDNSQDVIIDATIENTPALPGNLIGDIRTQSLVSGIAAMSLELIGGVGAQPEGKLANHQKIKAIYVGTDIIPPELNEEVHTAGSVLKGLDLYVNDPKIRIDLQQSLENFRHITETVQRSANNVETFSNHLQKVGDEASSTLDDAHATVRSAQADVEHLSRQIDDRMLQITKALDTFQSIADKVNNGQGTAGLLVSDPKLYQSLLDNSRELNLTIADLRRLLDQWEHEGVSFKLK
jgi:phospholipid/cholesterol/gamma-HCH transport system substrate-binding protein